MKRWKIATSLLLCLTLVGAVACGQAKDNGEEMAKPQLVEVIRGDLVVSVSGSGNVAVSREVNLSFDDGGKVDRIYVNEWDEVNQGDLIARLVPLDTDALELALAQSRAALAQSQAALAQSRVTLEQAKAGVDEANYDLEQLQRQHVSYKRQQIARLQIKA
ncbi:MAG: efflux RND transporter periplasmic adaptor subunit, partial [Dehalococcoidales bacterium]|nr:efflux RND transporter periplasmic adaptor subunit [Dehalococcoidales bacterium]